ncbi:hypothetical protein ASPVEDRAFT_40635 [Aspergillus versicolor CBS 583.65]|uniref:Uncharacterized protein n=1 Tax=Aspergillus versicolor CBS 583.65 TaxID=1036611 RepID=A0A1L9PHS4_ASPVE|nr:uncharacterized protein ASPVEDRAFT_40635 [Aspergillus versicolor CBS 583.65]OJJ01084.1 hypothetical protein ASPVEDRAFT_40635 [Aspergillus versicolor CBS 583.65]
MRGLRRRGPLVKMNENTLLLQFRHRHLLRGLFVVGLTKLIGGIGGGYGTPSWGK